MSIRDLLEETYSSLTSNKIRSGLTILGIVIGIASVIVMTAVGYGSQKTIEKNIQSLGSNLLNIRSKGTGEEKTLNFDDIVALSEQIEFIESIAPENSSSFKITTRGKDTNSQIVGTVSDYQKVNNVAIEKGVFINQKNLDSLSKVAVLGATISEDLFEKSDPIGQKIKINGIDFTVIGVNKAKGGSFNSPDDMVIIPITTFKQYLNGSANINSINIKVVDRQFMKTTEEQIQNLLLNRHKIKNIDDADFRIRNQEDILQTASSITGALTMLLGVVAGISLVVGGIGIMNMMLTTVTERTREIGLRKAIGAKKEHINLQFFLEATTLTIIGGIVGSLLGIGIAYLLKNNFGIETEVKSSSIILALSVSGIIGIVFGYYPAQKASKLNPIEALHYQ